MQTVWCIIIDCEDRDRDRDGDSARGDDNSLTWKRAIAVNASIEIWINIIVEGKYVFGGVKNSLIDNGTAGQARLAKF